MEATVQEWKHESIVEELLFRTKSIYMCGIAIE